MTLQHEKEEMRERRRRRRRNRGREEEAEEGKQELTAERADSGAGSERSSYSPA